MMRTRLVFGVLALLIAATPVFAQTTSSGRIGGRVFGWGDWQQMTAKESFDAVTGSSSLSGAGGGAEVHRLWRGVFVRASVSQMKAEGERVFVYDDTVFPLGIPMDITMMPIEAGAGWRFKALGGRMTPYLGAGALWVKYEETSDGDTASERVNETYPGAVVFGGIDVSVWRFVSAGAEVAWRTATVKNPGGSLGAFGEKDLGGVSVRVMVSIGR
jgi:hypothetical protein